MKRHNTQKKWLGIIVLGLLLSLLMGTAVQAGWKTTSKGKRYIDDSGSYVTDWQKIGKKWYFFGENGYLKKGWLTYGGKRYYLNKSTGERISGKWFKVGKCYYYAASNGRVQKSKWIGSRYVKKNYQRASGWLNINGYRYYFDKSTGKKTVGWKTIGKYKYHFNSKGHMNKNKWIKTGGKYYYVDGSGKRVVNTWVGKYQVGKDGARTGKIRLSGVVKENGKYYYYNSSYKKETGWKTYKGKKYYFNPASKAAYIGKKTIGGNTYYFNTDGTMATGWVTIGSDIYYFDAEGIMVKGTTITIGGKDYTFKANGVCNNANKGTRIAAYAKKFVGNPYVYGGNSLTKGCDCSGFTMLVMKKFGIVIPRVADDQRRGKDAYGTYTKSVAVKPNTANLKAGDLVFYGNPSGHVALYIGSGKIVHAKNENEGIVIDKFNYNKPSAARRYW
ncbi:MAG: NlpC/P60 family protein [Eubacteriales bacterium]|nr:NlpC/P60 family protein [Eubacteriales bacterium]